MPDNQTGLVACIYLKPILNLSHSILWPWYILERYILYESPKWMVTYFFAANTSSIYVYP